MQAMESGVKKAWLGFKNVKQEYEVTLDIKALAEYSGQGVCRYSELQDDTAARYREELRTWARSRNWRFLFNFYQKFYYLFP